MAGKVLLAVIAAAGILVAGAILVISSDDDDGEDSPSANLSPQPTLTATVQTEPQPTPVSTSTPVPTPDVADRVRNLKLASRPSEPLSFFRGTTSDIPEGTGLYVLDIASGEVQGWQAGSDLFAGPRFYLASDNRLSLAEYGVTANPEMQLIADLETETVYGWVADAQPVTGPLDGLAAAGNRLLFRLPVMDGADWYAVVDLEPGGVPVAAFEVDAQAGWLSIDGSRAVTVGAEVQAFDASSGELLWSHDPAIPAPEVTCEQYIERLQAAGFENAQPWRYTLTNTATSDGILVQVQPACMGPDSQEHWRHYSWEGELLAQGTGGIRPSPDGDYAWTGGRAPEGLPIAEAIDLRTGETRFRVVGAAIQGDYPVVLMPGNGGPDNWARATLEDGIETVPVENATSVHPAPGGGVVFAERLLDLYVRAVDLEGNQLGGFSPDPGTTLQGASFTMSPWGSVPGELRFVASARGSDNCCPTWSLVSPYIEVPPYEEDLPVVRLKPEAEGMALRDSAAGETVVGQVIGLEVRLIASIQINSQAGEGANDLHCAFLADVSGQEPFCQAPQSGLWLNVLTQEGTEGWLLVEARVNGL